MGLVLDVFLNLDTHLQAAIEQYGLLTYAILFLIIFCETGLVVMPFLPGDSLLFAAGTFAAMGILNIWLLFALMLIAAIAGNSLNFGIGSYIGPRAYDTRFIKKKHLEKTHKFFEKHGDQAVMLSRFAPIIRTVVPFVAGVGGMNRRHFLKSNAIGALLWVSLCLFGGFFFGNIPVVKEHFETVIIAIVVVSFVPAIVETVRHRGPAH